MVHDRLNNTVRLEKKRKQLKSNPLRELMKTSDMQVVEDGYEFFADRQLVTIFSAPNYCGEFNNAGALMNVDESLLCSFQILKPWRGRTAQPE